MTIKHLVISGGGPIMIQILAAIQHLETNDWMRMDDLESIYGTSAGAILAAIFALKYDWPTINDYVIKRPWQDVFSIKAQHILDAYTKKGIFDIKTIEKCFKPLFDAKDISLDITMKQFYELTHIDIHLFAFEINHYVVVDVSHDTYPDLRLLEAIQMSCALPILMTPVFIDDKCFMDGGVGCNYPLHFCIESGKNPDEILGFKNKYSDEKNSIHKECTLLDYILYFLFKSVFNVQTHYTQPTIKHEVVCDCSYLTFDILRLALSNIEIRKDLFEKGKQAGCRFLDLQDSI